MKHIITACLLTLSLVVGAQGIQAADSSARTTQDAPSNQRPKSMPFYGQVKAVDLTAQTLTLVGKEKDRVFRITANTKIHNAGETKKFEDVKVGRQVGGRAEAGADGEWVITTLNLGVKQGRQAAPEENGEQ